MRQREQLLLADAEQRALQRDRQRQVVRRHQDRVGKAHQVDDGDVLGQLQPVGAGDRNVRALQRLQHRVEQLSAAAHQHEDVARPQRPPLVGAARRLLPVDQSLIAFDARGELGFRAGFRNRVERRGPAFDVLLFVGHRQIPEIDDAGRRVGQRFMDRRPFAAV